MPSSHRSTWQRRVIGRRTRNGRDRIPRQHTPSPPSRLASHSSSTTAPPRLLRPGPRWHAARTPGYPLTTALVGGCASSADQRPSSGLLARAGPSGSASVRAEIWTSVRPHPQVDGGRAQVAGLRGWLARLWAWVSDARRMGRRRLGGACRASDREESARMFGAGDGFDGARDGWVCRQLWRRFQCHRRT